MSSKIKQLLEAGSDPDVVPAKSVKDYANMCIKTPLLYIAITPFIILIYRCL